MGNKLREYALSEITDLKVHGRTTKNLSPLTLFWTGSAIEWNVSGSELWLEVEAGYDLYEPWICTIINSVPVSRQMLTAGRYWICIFRGMKEDTVKNIRIVKDTQAMSGDAGCCLQIHGIRTDGEFHAINERPYKIEFIGDSISSGEGAIGAREEEDWIPMWFSAVHNYCTLTAEALDADYRIISQSGWGVMTSWDNNPNYNIPDCYERVCGVLTGDRNEALGALCENDFSSWQPDVIVVNLGTNDGSAFYNLPWKDEKTGKVYQQRANSEGSLNEEDVTAFETAAGNFIRKLRKYNKKAFILWAYGLAGDIMMPAIKRAVESYITNTGDHRAAAVLLPNTTEDTVGARSHPGRCAHEKAAKVLIDYIKGIL